MSGDNQCKLVIYYSDNHHVDLTIDRKYADRIIERLDSYFCKSIIVGTPYSHRFLIIKDKIRNVSIEEHKEK